MVERPHLVRVFLDVRDPWARRVLRDALARERDVRFVSTMSAADVVLGDAAARTMASPIEPDAAGDHTADGVATEMRPSATLTDRERDVLQALAEGASNDAIADHLGISRSTVKFHLHALYEKLGVRRRAEAVAAGVRRGDVLL
ncbi:MAG: LuxR C-terminal-related transcriptional regulator [Gemmatimonadaceae bacterium]|nr:LuxR C-terminal-related transcriptional regulator [Gemmatimonadaceae bacterium]